MKYFVRLIMALLAFVLFCMVSPQNAYAYIDPGTGSYILQMIIAFLVGASFAIKIYWRKIRTFFTNLFSKIQKDEKNDN